MLLMRVFRAIASADRIQEVLDSEPEIAACPDPVSSHLPSGRVAFEQVTFDYHANSGEPVLRDVSLRANPGQTIALVGPTGAGRTTIVNLLTRFYDIDEGCIAIDGQDIRAVRKDSLHRH